jgi:hypothetical protein
MVSLEPILKFCNRIIKKPHLGGSETFTNNILLLNASALLYKTHETFATFETVFLFPASEQLRKSGKFCSRGRSSAVEERAQTARSEKKGVEF